MAIEATKAQLQQRLVELEAEMRTLEKILEDTRRSEKLHRLTLENIADTVIITDDDGNFVHICPNTTNIFGMTKLEVFRMGRIDTLMGGRVCRAADLKTAGIVENVEWTVEDKSGDEHFLLITVKAVQIEGGTRLYIMRDVTARRQVEMVLAESESRFRTIVNVLPQFVAYMDRDYRYRLVNQTYEKRFGITPQAIMGKKMAEVIGEAAFAKLQPYAARALQGEKIQFNMQFDFSYSKESRHIDGRLIPDIGADGEINGCYAVMTDVTPYMQMQTRLQESQLRYRNLINSLPGTAYQFVLTASGEVRFDFMGKNCHRLFGCSAEEILADAGRVFDLIPQPDADKVQAAIRRSAASMQPYEMDHRVMQPGGETLWIHTVSTPRRLSNGDIIWDGIGLDDTRRRLSEEAREKSYRELRLREAITKRFLTSPRDRLFSEIIALLRAEFDCQYGYIGYLDQNGDLCCPSLTHDVWEKCRMENKCIVFPKAAWGGLWGASLEHRRAFIRNQALTPPQGHLPLDNVLLVPMQVDANLVGQIALANTPGGFQEADRRHLEGLAGFIAPIMLLYLEKERHHRSLQRSAIALHEKNIALNVLLENRTDEQKKMADTILENFERLVFPYFEKLKATSAKNTIATILDIVSTNTLESLAPLEKSVSGAYRAFTPLEIQVADLIKAGKTSKQIAVVLNLSTRAVYFHRNNIRKKLKIHKTKANLATVLKNLPNRPDN
jgi:PAS domain S-box-containing protein